MWYRPVDTYTHKHTHTHRQTHKHQLFNSIACEIKDRQTHKRQHYNSLALLMDIEFSIDKLMCKWRDMELYIKISCSKLWSVRIVLCFVVFIIQNRYCTQYKSRSMLLKPGSYKPGIVHCSKSQTKPHQNRGSDQVYTDQVSAWFNGGLNHGLDHCSKIGPQCLSSF